MNVAPGRSRGMILLEAKLGEAVHTGNLVCFLYLILEAR